VREGDNPWYEMTLIEGRNRQIRRMFQEIGHHVEKIRRVRYGPLELDVEPGKLRHLTTKEVAQLKAAASARKAVSRTARDGS
jgi:23S rRNA pseudouridine2605 synthase